MAGVDAENELLLRPVSKPLNRCCGSGYATSVAQTLIKIEIQGLEELSVELDEIRQSPTFAALVEMIHTTLTKEIDIREENNISFTAKDDL